MTAGGELHLALCFNPSHLEIVAPVVEGSVRARQERRENEKGSLVYRDPRRCRVCRTGCGDGNLQMSQTRAYKTGGTLHIVLNNQVGFTTSKARGCAAPANCWAWPRWCKLIFHVNADDQAVLLSRN